MRDNKDLDNEMLEENESEMDQNKNLTSAEKIQVYIEKNGKKIIIISLVVIVATVAFFYLKNKFEKDAEANQQLAGASLARIMQYYNSNDYEKALLGDPSAMVRDQKVIGLVDIAKKFKGTSESYMAAFYAGNCFLHTQKPKEAKEQFKYALESTSKLVLEGANAGMGACSEYENNFKEAIDYYKKAISYSIAFDSKARYSLYEGLCYEKLNDKQNAEKTYRDIINQSRSEAMALNRSSNSDNSNEFVRQAKAGLARLGMIID
jgi:tetratricopeptide (TPR) repeat protein